MGRRALGRLDAMFALAMTAEQLAAMHDAGLSGVEIESYMRARYNRAASGAKVGKLWSDANLLMSQ